MQSVLKYFTPLKSRPNLIEITNLEECRKLFSLKFVIIFKHSQACDLSRSAYRAVTRFCDQRPEAEIYLISVLDSRAIATMVEEHTGVRHESPQVLAVRDGAVVADASHRRITFELLEKFSGLNS